jgi:hypothetical protein
MSIIPNFPQSLLDLHHNWHVPGAHTGGGPGRAIPAGQPGSGLEFLTFHRNFVAQFHTWYDPQPFADQAAVAPWTAIPAALKNPAQTFWNSSLAGQEARIISNSPPFATADELGIFIEDGIHNWIHGATATVFNEPEVGSFHSPRSTYFYNIHGLVDFWWNRWSRTQKSRIKDIIDTKNRLKEVEKIPKELIKDIIKDAKEFEKIPKELIKDIFEGGGLNLGGDPALRIAQLEGRLAHLEGQQAAGQAFIRAEERPDVGARAMAEAGAALIERHPDEDARPMVAEAGAEPATPGEAAPIEHHPDEDARPMAPEGEGRGRRSTNRP